MIGPLVAAHRVSCLESPSSAVPFAFSITAKVGRIIVLGDFQLNVKIPLQILLHELDLGGHLWEIFIVEESCFKTISITGFSHEFLCLLRTILPIGTEVGG